MKKRSFKKLLKTFFVLFLVTSWLVTSWPAIPFINFPPKIQNAQAVAQGDGIVLYAKSTNDGVYQRTFTAPSTVSGETNILSGFTDTIRYIELKAAPTRNEMIAVVQAAISTTGSSIVVLKWNGSAWSVPFCIRTGGGTIGGTACTNATYITNANTVRRAIAVEYENTSGDAMVLYSSGASGTNGLKYQTWNGSTWSGETNLDSARLTGIITWVELIPKPAANEMTALIVDSVNRDLSALVWDGTSAWGTEPAALLEAELEDIGAGTNPTVRPFDGAYESSSGDFLAGWGYSIAETEATELRYVQRPSGGAWGSVTTPTTWPEIATIVDMAGDPDSTSNYIVHASQDPAVATADDQCAVWSGTAWPATPANCDTTAGNQIAGNQGFGVGFLKSGSTKRAIVVYPDAASAGLDWYPSDPAGNIWTVGADFAITGATSAITTPVEVVMDPFNTNILMATVQKGTGIHMLKLSMDATPTFTWTNPLDAALATSPTTGLYQPFSFSFNRFIPPTTTLGAAAGSDPATTTVAPGSGIRDAGAFTFQTDTGTDTITALTVTLAGSPASSWDNLSEVRITSSDGATLYFAAATPTGDTVNFSGGTPIPAGTGATTFKIRVTPETHLNMPVPPGDSYNFSPYVSDWTSGNPNTKAGSDSNANTLTIDNLSPNGATVVSGSGGNQNVTLNWTTSSSGDFDTTSGSIVYRWASGSAGSETPDEGNTPTLGSTDVTATVACVVSSAVSTPLTRVDGSGGSADCTTTALTNGQQYTYKVFQRDTRGNYDVGVTIGTFTPAVADSTFTQNTYRWYVDNDGINPADVWGIPDIAENTAIVIVPAGNDPPNSTQELRLRMNFTVNTTNLPVTSKQFKLQFKAGTDGSCTTGSWTDLGAAQTWEFATSTVTDGADITASLSNTTTGKGEEYAKSNPTQTNHVAANTTEIIEYDFHIIGTNISSATQYSFRVIESDNTVFDGYPSCPTLTTEPGTGDIMRHGNVFSSGSEKGFFWAD